ncbi:uncharacterized protein LOC106158283 [Lingula anatina]|uniref:Uncharacterized protein LOC106158283 n=1 Tax=Lingula anatina TaxID=7574 RepID=A0A1S3HX68_LINAN|nr:uncharacterized protein LOC106158283 [Lingula anatina]|eukprot:XP_013389659.1 uncharacterized protein LOC106158283 [Lingula anatina]
MPRKPARKGKERCKASKRIREDFTEGSPPREATPPPADESAAEVEKDVADSAAQSVAAESVASDVDDELAASSQSKSKKARVLSNLTENEQEEVALFLERSDFIYNKRRADHTFVSKKNKVWNDLAQEMGKEVKALTTFFESIRTQMGKLRRKKSRQAAVDMTDRQQWIWTRFQFLVPHSGQVTNRTVQSFRSSATISQGEKSQEEEAQNPVTTSLSTTATGSLTVTEPNRGCRSRGMGPQILDQALHTCQDRQEKLLQILQAPSVPVAPHPERLKFAEYLGHAFQNLPQSIYRDVRVRRPFLTFYTTPRSRQMRKQEDQHQNQHQHLLNSTSSGSRIPCCGSPDQWLQLSRCGTHRIQPGSTGSSQGIPSPPANRNWSVRGPHKQLPAPP